MDHYEYRQFPENTIIGQPKNGRLDIITPPIQDQFALYDKNPVHQCVTYRDALNGIWENTPLSNAYFSKENMQIIQNGIRAGVYQRSNGKYVIGEQDCDTLRIIMRTIFLQNAVNAPTSIRDQIIELNNLVYEYCIPRIHGEAEGYIQYKRDVSNMYTPISRPMFSNYKHKTLELKPWF
jgi:hypothetical protein